MTVQTSDEGELGKRAAGSDLRLLARLLPFLLVHRRLFWVALLSYPLSSLAVVVPPYLVQLVLDEAVAQRDVEALYRLCGAYLLAVALEYAAGFVTQHSLTVLGMRAITGLRRKLFAHLVRLPASFLDKQPTGRLLTRLTNDVEAVAELFSTGAVTIVGDLLTIAAVFAAMLWLDVRLTLLAFVVVPPLILVVEVFRRFARRAFTAIRKHLATMNAFLAEHIGAMAVVQAFRQEERTQGELDAVAEKYNDANRTAILFDALLYSMVEAVGTLAVAAMIWWGAAALSAGDVGPGLLVAFVQYIRRFFIPIRDLSTKYTVLQSAFASAERVFRLLDVESKIVSRSDARPVPGLREGLVFSDVWFSYQGEPAVDAEAHWQLRGLDLRLRRGERLALVGATGAGKSTILKLLNRTYDVTRGSLCLDGVDVRHLDLAQLRGLFAFVPQEVHLFSGTVLDNLRLDGRLDEASVRRAAEALGTDAVFARLPGGYDAPVGERGKNLSMGERQLVALTRALALPSEVVVFDEATSSVDTESEAKIQSALRQLFQQRTAVVVAHRLSTVREVDRIIVVDAGRVVEEGSHEQLIAADGLYRKLAVAQLEGG